MAIHISSCNPESMADQALPQACCDQEGDIHPPPPPPPTGDGG